MFIVHNVVLAQAFKEESGKAGIDHFFYNVDQLGGGLAFLDFNNDGFEDIYVTGGSHADKLYENQGDETFQDVSETHGINVLSQINTVGVSAADFDNDGYTDLFISTDIDDRCYILWNKEGGFFEEKGIEGNITEEFFGTSIAVGDYDLDGDLDIYVGNYRSLTGDAFYRNNGNRTFTNVSESLLGDKSKGIAWAVAFSDWDLDNDIDILIGNDFGNIVQPNRLFQNNYPENAFTEISENVSFDEEMNSMGIAVGDYDEDGDFDYYITDTGDNNFFVNNGDQFNDKALELGIGNPEGTSWGSTFVDYNNDMFLDLLVMNGEVGLKDGLLHENKLYKGNGTSFEDVSAIEGVNSYFTSRGMALGDYNNDGKIDFASAVVDNQPNSNSHFLLYRNKNNNMSNWIKFELEGTHANKDGYGSLFKLEVDGRTLIKEQTGGSTFLSSHTKTTHFGLAANNKIDRITITWPGGKKSFHDNLDANKTYRIVENGELFTIVSRKLSLAEGETVFLEGSNQTKPGIYRDTLAVTSPRTIRITKLDFEADGSNNQGSGNIDKENSVARCWNELLLESIRNDYARPTIHARNLFHLSVAMYDAFAVYDDEAKLCFLGNKVGGYSIPFNGVVIPSDINEARKEAISYACFRLLNHRFKNSPGYNTLKQDYNNLMLDLGYDGSFTNTDYSSGNPAALGNYIGEQIIAFGLQDGSNEVNDYKNIFYVPKNDPLVVNESGNSTLTKPNNWQPLTLKNFIDQSGNVIGADTPDFLSPEWGKVTPYALKDSYLTIKNKGGQDYWIYHDPGKPVMIKTDRTLGLNDPYKWGFSLVSVWSSQLDPSDGEMIDISPNTIGNIDISDFPKTFEEYKTFYNLTGGGDISKGYTVNPITGSPYQTQMVRKGDYTRVLAEFWADGPDSELPPGHWFTILNYINDHPLAEKKFNGKGDVLSDLEWDVKAYLALGGAMHDAAVTAWGIKGYYDYIRPISAIRYMAGKGQSTDTSLPNYDPEGIPLIPGYIEVVQNGDLLSGIRNSNAGKIKLLAWKGSDFIDNPSADKAGVDWILAGDWVPYQRPTFVTPPFAGYVSGHSTFSRAAAVVLTKLTGSNFFPGGMGIFDIEKNDFLVFEDGPSMNLTLQWATYQDASDQCSLSRIWGGIHPPIDDIAGRIAGEKIGIDAFSLSESIFYEDKDGDGFYSYEDIDDLDSSVDKHTIRPNRKLDYILYPVPLKDEINLKITDFQGKLQLRVFTIYGALIYSREVDINYNKINIPLHEILPGAYIMVFTNKNGEKVISQKIIKQ